MSRNLETLMDIEFVELDKLMSQAYFDILVEDDEGDGVIALVVNYEMEVYSDDNSVTFDWNADINFWSYFDEQDVADIERYIETTLTQELLGN